jgi:hypothetical protein
MNQSSENAMAFIKARCLVQMESVYRGWNRYQAPTDLHAGSPTTGWF